MLGCKIRHEAVVLLVYSPEYNGFLCITRPSNKLGFPGGKVDNLDLSIYDAMQRELKEELGVICYSDELKYIDYVLNDSFIISIFTPSKYLQSLILEKYKPNMTTPENQTTDYLSDESLVNSNICEFWKENIDIMISYHLHNKERIITHD